MRIIAAAVLVGVVVLGSIFLGRHAVRSERQVLPVDLPLTTFFADHRITFLVVAFRIVAYLAGPVGLFLTLAVATALRYRRTRRIDVLPVAVGVLCVDGIESVIKVIVNRSRPPFPVADVSAMGASFPSGHSTQSAAIYGLIAFWCFRRQPGTPGRPIVVVAAFVAVGIVAFSRLYLGVHYLSDVLAGLIIGASWLLLVLAVADHPGLAQREPSGKVGP